MYCIGNAMRHEFASCFSLPCSLEADVYNGNALKKFSALVYCVFTKETNHTNAFLERKKTFPDFIP